MLEISSVPAKGDAIKALLNIWDFHGILVFLKFVVVDDESASLRNWKYHIETKAAASGEAEAAEATARAVSSKDCATLVSTLLLCIHSTSFSAATAAAWPSCRQRHCRIAASTGAENWEEEPGLPWHAASKIAAIA